MISNCAKYYNLYLYICRFYDMACSFTVQTPYLGKHIAFLLSAVCDFELSYIY